MVEERRRSSIDVGHMLGRHLCVELRDRRQSDAEISSFLTTLLIGGTETFPKVFTGGIVRLDALNDPRSLLLDDRSLEPNAIE